jgi:hypothetical protein
MLYCAFLVYCWTTDAALASLHHRTPRAKLGRPIFRR